MDGLNQQPFPVSIIKCFFFVFFICILYQLNDVVWLRGLLDAGCNSVALVCLLYFQFKPNFFLYLSLSLSHFSLIKVLWCWFALKMRKTNWNWKTFVEFWDVFIGFMCILKIYGGVFSFLNDLSNKRVQHKFSIFSYYWYVMERKLIGLQMHYSGASRNHH